MLERLSKSSLLSTQMPKLCLPILQSSNAATNFSVCANSINVILPSLNSKEKGMGLNLIDAGIAESQRPGNWEVNCEIQVKVPKFEIGVNKLRGCLYGGSERCTRSYSR